MKYVLTLSVLLGLILAESAQATYRYALGSFWGRGYSCYQSDQIALQACYRATDEFAKTHAVTGNIGCAHHSTVCSAYSMPESALMGYAEYDDPFACFGPERGRYFMKSSQGYSCGMASYYAARSLYDSLRYFSAAYPVMDFRLGGCSCNGYGPIYASCRASVRYTECQ